ncbi:hypothetical protein HN51_021741, partial [Arachis hypogaea]
ISGKKDPPISSSKNKLKTPSWQERRKLERDRKQKEEDEQTLAKVEAPIPQSNIGFKLLKQMGYTSGAALGKEGLGRLSQWGLRFDDRELAKVALDQLENREIIEPEKNEDDEEEEDEEEEEITEEMRHWPGGVGGMLAGGAAAAVATYGAHHLTHGHYGIYIINLGKTWEKLQLAARIIVAIENPQDIIVQPARPYG